MADRTAICIGESATPTAAGPVTYTWLANNSMLVSQIVFVSPLALTVYSVFGASSNGCFSSTSIVVTVGTCTGLKDISESAGTSVFPNPTNGNFTIELPDSKSGELQILNALSQVVYLHHFDNENKMTVDINTLANGIYYLKIIIGTHETLSKKIIKQ